MTDLTIALKEHLYKLGLGQDSDFLRQAVAMLAQMPIMLEHQNCARSSCHRWRCRIGVIKQSHCLHYRANSKICCAVNKPLK